MKNIFLLILIFGSFSINIFSQEISSYSSANHGIEFIRNDGQFINADGTVAKDVKFVADYGGQRMYLRNDGISFVFTSVDMTEEERKARNTIKEILEQDTSKKYNVETERIDLQFLGANRNAFMSGLKQTSYNNYILSHCSLYEVPVFRQIKYENVYDGIDLLFYENGAGEMEYDFIVRPGADPSQIKLKVDHAEAVFINEENRLEIRTKLGKIEKNMPLVYQEAKSNEIKSSYRMSSDGIISFNIDSYDKSKELIVDPVVQVWGTYYGAEGSDRFQQISFDPIQQYLYLVGATTSWRDYIIVTPGAHQELKSEEWDVLLIKFTRDCKRIWATYFGGLGYDIGYDIDVNQEDEIIIVGKAGIDTEDWIFGEPGSFQDKKADNMQDGFISKFKSNGELEWTTYFGDAEGEWLFCVDLDGESNIYVGGFTKSGVNLVSDNAHQTKNGGYMDCLIAKFDTDGNRIWCTLLGDIGHEQVNDIKLDHEGNVIIGGISTSLENIASEGTHRSERTGLADLFIVKFSNDGEYKWGTYWGGIQSEGEMRWHNQASLEIDSSNNIYIRGNTTSLDSFNIVTDNAYQKWHGQVSRINPNHHSLIIGKFNQDGLIEWGTYYGGPYSERFGDLDIDQNNNIHIASRTNSWEGIATEDGIQTKYWTDDYYYYDGFYAIMTEDCKRLYGTYLGSNSSDDVEGISVDASNNIYICGTTNSDKQGYIVTENGYDTEFDGVLDAFIIKLTDKSFKTYFDTETFCAGDTIEIPFEMHYQTNEDNRFIAQISNGSGDFHYAQNIGETEVNDSIITAVLPDDLVPGSNYRFRVISTDPVYYSGINETPVQIYSKPNTEIVGFTDVCRNDTKLYSTLAEDYEILAWELYGGEIQGRQDTNAVLVKWTNQTVGEIRISKTSGGDCTFYDTLTVKIHDKPEVTLEAIPEICENDEPFEMTQGRPEGGEYSGDGIEGNMFNPAEAGAGEHQIKYKFENEYGCADSATVMITVLPSPDQPEISRNGDTLISSADEGNQWYKDMEEIEGATDKKYLPVVSGQYTVTQTNDEGCESDHSEAVDMVVSVSETSESLKIYPNPAEDQLIIENSEFISKIEIYNSIGNLERSIPAAYRKSLKINCSGLSSGLYFLRIYSEGRIFTESFVVVK